MPGESLSFSITADDRASSKFRDVGRAAADSSVKIDLAAASLKLWDDTATKQGKAANTSLNAMKAHARATSLLADAENVLAGRATTATRLLADQGRNLDDAGKRAESAASGFSALAGTGGIPGGGMGALIGAGVILSPILATVGTGLTGFGLAAVGVARPIEAAAQKTGGLQANLAKLNPEQRQVAQGLLSLGGQFGTFEKQLQPEVFGVFNKGLSLAGHLLHDVEPVATATGRGLANVLGQVDKEFASGNWQQFFGFMAKEAGPDLQQLGGLFTGLLGDLPPLVEGLQPLASGLVGVATDATKVISVTSQLHVSLPILGAAIGAFAGGPIGALIGGLTGVSLELAKVHTSVDATIPSWTKSASATAGAIASLDAYGPEVAKYIQWLHQTDQAGKSTTDVQKQFAAMTAKAATQTGLAGTSALVAGPKFFSLNKAVAALNTSMTKLVGNLLTLQGSELSWKQALQAAETQVKSNTAGLEGNSKNALANKQAVLASTQAAISFAQQELTTGKNISGASTTVQQQIRWLQGLHDKSKFVQNEIHALRLEEQKLQAQRINQTIHVQGLGQWQVSQSLAPGVGHRRAMGGLIPGAGNSDTYPALLTPGEVVVPKGMVSAGAVDHLRGRLPGFASGGIVPAYSGSAGGVRPWVQNNDTATIHLIDEAVAKATLAGMRAAQSAAASTGFGGHGVVPTGPIQSYARSLVGKVWPGLGEWLAFADVVARESGWNPFARNPSSGAYGIPQALPPGKMASAGADWATNPYTQLRWMVGYIGSRWGDPIAADRNEVLAHWYDKGGLLKPGWTLAYNGTGRPEMVLPNRPAQTAAPVMRRGQGAPLVNVAQMIVQDATDANLVAQRLSFSITAAGLGS